MAEAKKSKDILEFVNKTCNLFDTYIEFNKDLANKFQNLKQFGLSIINELNNDSETHVNSDQEVTNLINISNFVNTTNQIIENNPFNVEPVIQETSANEMEIDTNGTETHEIMPQSPSIITNNKLKSKKNEPIKSNLEKLFEHINMNKLDDLDDIETDHPISVEVSQLTESELRERFNLKDVRIVLKPVAADNIRPKRNSMDEDSEINRICDFDNILKQKTATEQEESIPNGKAKETNRNSLDQDDKTEDDESDEELDPNESQNLKSLLESMGLVKKNEQMPDNLDERLDSMDENDDTLELDEQNQAKNQKKIENSKKKEIFMPELAIPSVSLSTDEESSNQSSTKQDKRPKKVVNSDDESDGSSSKTAKSSDEKESTESEKQSENEEEDDKTPQNSQNEDEDEIISPLKNKNKKLRISSNENSSNESEKEEIIEQEVTESSKSSDEEIVTLKKKKRGRPKTSRNGDESGSEELDEDTSSRDSEDKKFKKNKRLKKKFKTEPKDNKSKNSDDSDSSVVELNSDDEEEKKKTRQKIRAVIDDQKLAKETQEALNEEKQRKKRLEEKKNLEATTSKSNPSEVYLDIDPDTKKCSVKIDDSLVKVLKPYQLEGVQFMYNCCFESIKMMSNPKNKGSGCLLAHCMGLGKTLQVVTLVHTLLANKTLTKCSRVLILMPVNVQLNWREEFKNWLAKCESKVKIFDLPNEKQGRDKVIARCETLDRWFSKGGVFLMGYNIFSLLVHGKNIKPKKYVEKFKTYLLSPGPDLIICDEGHLLKNLQSSMAKAVNQVETKRRVVLTGTPLQNNLLEYHCMVSFVKPNLLGNVKEFRNRFVNPINNGQHKDSTDADVRIMKKRAHVLHNALDGCVNRKDFSVIRKFLPPKNEYVLSVRLSDKQISLYTNYLVKQRGIENINNLGKVQGAQLFTDFQMLSRIWTHPWVLKINETRVQKIELKNQERNFIDDEDDEDVEEIDNFIVDDDKSDKASTVSDVDDDIIMESSSDVPANKNTKYKTRNSRVPINGGGINDNQEDSKSSAPSPLAEPAWWSETITPDCEYDFELSGKLVVLGKILDICDEKRDKLILFSQSIMSLDLIEKFLDHLTKQGKNKWIKNKDYFRIDGQVDIAKRKDQVTQFNDPENPRSRLFIISTKAGGIGINLIGANRCIVFDASWNPSYDTQSIFRIYRLGQQKEVFIYRFLSQGTMEEKIYQRQVTKQSLSQRVVDEHQLDRHFTSNELRELYAFEPDTGTSEIPNLPTDDLLRRLLMECKKWIVRYHDHESLLENKLDEGLSEEDRKAAWDEYEAERLNPYNPYGSINTNTATNQPYLNNQFTEENVLYNNIMIKLNNPNISAAQQNYYKTLLQSNQIYQNNGQNNYSYQNNGQNNHSYQSNTNFNPNQNRLPVDLIQSNYANMHPNIQNHLSKTSNGANMQQNYLPNINTVTPITNVSNHHPNNVSELLKRYVSASSEAEKLQLSNQIKLANPAVYQQLIMVAKKVNRL